MPQSHVGRGVLVIAFLGVGCYGSVAEPAAPGSTPISPPGALPGEQAAPTVGATTGDPGRVTLHRLNRAEYNNTVHDLLGTSLRPADDFPADDRGYGFDNIADVLSLSPLQIEMYQHAAEQLIDEALRPDSKTGARGSLLVCDAAATDDTCLRTVIGGFARRAWRRPPAVEELDRLDALVKRAQAAGETGEAAVRVALEAVLVSPYFVFRVETDAQPTSLVSHALNPHEIASRLSYFLWSSMPDAELFAAADANSLVDPGVLSTQVARLLASPKAASLVDNFAGQWLFIRKLDDVQPDHTTFPSYDTNLREAMRGETQLIFRELLADRLTFDHLLNADFTFVNDRLAKHYLLPAPGSAQLTRVSVEGTARGGLLTQGSLLTVTSYPTRTSPVQRGRWVLEQLLCSPPPDPPPGTPGLKTEVTPSGSLRQRMEQHRQDPTCAACHKVMDPIGFGLESYDGIGAFRTTDQTFAIDTSGSVDGKDFNGPGELAKLLAADPRYAHCLVEKLFTYALGRGPLPSDAGSVDAVAQRFVRQGYHFNDLLTAVVQSDLFRSRRGEPEAGDDPSGGKK